MEIGKNWGKIKETTGRVPKNKNFWYRVERKRSAQNPVISRVCGVRKNRVPKKLIFLLLLLKNVVHNYIKQ